MSVPIVPSVSVTIWFRFFPNYPVVSEAGNQPTPAGERGFQGSPVMINPPIDEDVMIAVTKEICTRLGGFSEDMGDPHSMEVHWEYQK